MQRAKYGIFITFEGTEGSGKSTLIREVAEQFSREGHLVTQTREPGGVAVAEKIRSILLENDMDPWTELFLYEAARIEHLVQVVRPALEKGSIVLCDRFTDSTLAYQSSARGLSWKQVKSLNQMAMGKTRPNLTILLDIDPEKGLLRAQDPNRFERQGVEFQKKVRKGYLRARSEDPKRWFIIHADSGSPQQLAENVIKEVKKRWKSRFKS